MIWSLYTIIIGTVYTAFQLLKESVSKMRPLDDHTNGHLTDPYTICASTAEYNEMIRYVRGVDGMKEADDLAASVFDTIPGLEGKRLGYYMVSQNDRKYNERARCMLLMARKYGKLSSSRLFIYMWPMFDENGRSFHVTAEHQLELMRWLQAELRQHGADIQLLYKKETNTSLAFSTAPRYGDEWKLLD